VAETRKLVAIFVVDVAGYSKLAGTDEERTLAMLLASSVPIEGAS
jgi:adenylate cyclase